MFQLVFFLYHYLFSLYRRRWIENADSATPFSEKKKSCFAGYECTCDVMYLNSKSASFAICFQFGFCFVQQLNSRFVLKSRSPLWIDLSGTFRQAQTFSKKKKTKTNKWRKTIIELCVYATRISALKRNLKEKKHQSVVSDCSHPIDASSTLLTLWIIRTHN